MLNALCSAEAWAALVKAVKQLPGVLDISDTGRAQCGISATRTTLLSAGRGDLKVIWEAVRGAELEDSAGLVLIEEDDGWERLEQLLDMSEDQWQTKFLEGDSLNSSWDSHNSDWDSQDSSFLSEEEDEGDEEEVEEQEEGEVEDGLEEAEEEKEEQEC